MAEKDAASVAGSEDSFVNVASSSAESLTTRNMMDFVIKIGFEDDNGVTKFHRFRLGSLVEDSSTAKMVSPKKGNTTSMVASVSYTKLLKQFQGRLDGDDGNVTTAVDNNKHNDVKVALTYKDVDGDLCAVSSGDDLMEAIQQFTATEKPGFLKLHAIVSSSTSTTTKTTTTTKTKTEASNNNTHVNGPSPSPSTKTSTSPSSTNRILSTPAVVARIQRAMQGPTEIHVLENLEEAPRDVILSHLLEEFQDHQSLDFSPAFFVTENNNNDGDDEEETPLWVHYEIQGKSYKSRYFAMDDIFLDLTEGPLMEPDGEGIVRAAVPLAIPRVFLGRILNQLQGHDHPPQEPLELSHLELDPVLAHLDPNNPPPVKAYRQVTDANGTVSIHVQELGPLTELFRSSEHRHFYKISGIFEARQVCGPPPPFFFDPQQEEFGLFPPEKVRDMMMMMMMAPPPPPFEFPESDSAPDEQTQQPPEQHMSLALSLVEVVLFEAHDHVLNDLKNSHHPHNDSPGE